MRNYISSDALNEGNVLNVLADAFADLVEASIDIEGKELVIKMKLLL